MEGTLTGRVGTEHPLYVQNSGLNSINATATATADQMVHGVIKSTSLSATSITTPTAAAILAGLALYPCAFYDFAIDNSAGANTVTLVLDASIAAYSAVTGGTTLTVASGKVGFFRIYFTTTTAAQISRIA